MENRKRINNQYLYCRAEEYAIMSDKKQNDEYEKFKAMLHKFDEISSLDEAQKLAKRLLNAQNGTTYLKAGNGFCTIQQKKDILRIILNSEKELICYNYITKGV